MEAALFGKSAPSPNRREEPKDPWISNNPGDGRLTTCLNGHNTYFKHHN
jgi:hypothetical protein